MKEVRPGVWFVEADKRGRYPYAHCLYVKGEENLLIDTGAGPFLEELAGKTRQVVLSHYHRDHVSYNHFFKGASFSIHEKDLKGVESLDSFLQFSGLGQIDIQSYWDMVSQSKFRATKIDHTFKEGDVFDLGDLKLKVLHLPGHTPGHCGFLIEKYNLIFAADIDLTDFGPWYGNATSDLEQFRASIKRLQELGPELIITGHSPPVEDKIKERLINYEAVIDQRDLDILTALRKQPASLEELSAKSIIYRRHYGLEVLLFFERQMVRQHLESLLKRRLIIKTGEGCYEAL